MDDARIDAAAAYRGFLFSDMRGFTAFAERYGNTAAAAMVGRFLEIARTAIARHDGSEITTEGDAIHAVFSSASSAVLCGLEIVDTAAALNAKDPDGHPLVLGVGVHAGEAIETAEGYIGRAVNIAARLCATARPGEVLVSSTVKGIMQASIAVAFIPLGRRRLKGIQDPILVYAVTRDMTARAPRRVPRPVLLGGGGVAIVLVIAIAFLAGSQFLAKPGALPSPTAAPTIQPLVIGPLPIGTYRSREFQPAVAFDIVDQGWTANRDRAEVLGLVRDSAPRGSLSLLRVQEVIANPCVEGGEGTQTDPGAAELLAQLQALPHLALANQQPIQVGGIAGQQVDVTVADGALAACGGLVGGEAAIFSAGGEVWSATPGERFRLISVGVNDQALTILLSTDWTQTPSVQELEQLLGVGQRVVDSLKF
jgi:class 3 adenylate cyclase